MHRTTRVGWPAALGLIALAVGGCSGGGHASRSAPTSTAGPIASTTSGAKGSATAHLTLVGDAGLAGVVGKPTVRCSLPSLGGTEILVFGQAAGSAVSERITLVGGTVTVGVDTGSGSQYRERDFSGTGVTGFDPATGARLDATLKEVPPRPGSPSSTLGAVRSISGTVDCGSQQPGGSTLVFSGASTAGSVKGRLSPVNVSCQNGNALVIGILPVGAGHGLVDMFISAGSFSFFIATQSPLQDQFKAGAGVATATSSGFHVSGSATDAGTGGARAHVVHVDGAVTCA